MRERKRERKRERERERERERAEALGADHIDYMHYDLKQATGNKHRATVTFNTRVALILHTDEHDKHT